MTRVLTRHTTLATIGWVGGVALALAIAWWSLLYPTVVANTGLGFAEALPCIASASDLCLLAAAQCGGSHLFGIAHYSPTLFWCGVGLLGTSLLALSMLPPSHR
jgi:hypothetical protein